MPDASGRTAIPPALPAAVGSGALWAKCRQAVDRSFRAHEWLVLEGEPGTGKTTLARAVHQSRTPAAHLRVFDANDHSPRWIADLIDELATGGGTLVLTHLDRLPPDEMGVLVEVLDPTESIDADGHWVVATIGKQRSDRDPDLTTLLSLFPDHRGRRCATTSRTSQSWYRTCWADSPGAATWRSRPR